MSDQLMTCDAGFGKELSDMLRANLNIPAHVTKFSVHFGVDEVVTVDCTYYATEPSRSER
jgi:hypothetical protein